MGGEPLYTHMHAFYVAIITEGGFTAFGNNRTLKSFRYARTSMHVLAFIKQLSVIKKSFFSDMISCCHFIYFTLLLARNDRPHLELFLAL